MPSAVVVPSSTAPLKRVTVEPASAVPDIVGVESFIEIRLNEVGVFGFVASIVIAIAEDSVDSFPAASTALTVSE